ncbi:MAG: 2-C-methyl-D-erythritol 4-phosphate cytidylyltransferase [Patescibacteria group bacterium]
MMKIHAIILSAGSGGRFKSEGTFKQYIKLAGEPIFFHTLKAFLGHSQIDDVVLVTDAENEGFVRSFIREKGLQRIRVVVGGSTRQESSKIALRSLNASPDDYVLIHDAVRPFVSERIINEMIAALDANEAVDVAIPSADTLIKVKDRYIEKIPDRSSYMRGQTPQGFIFRVIMKAHQLAEENNDYSVTDDCGLVIRYCGSKVYVVMGDDLNMKVTYPLDIHIADKIFQLRSTYVGSLRKELLQDKTIIIVGHSSGIGKAIYDICKENGAKVSGFSRSNGVDISDGQLVKHALESVHKKLGMFDAVIITAGILVHKNFKDQEEKEVREQVNINYTGTIMLAKTAIDYLNRGGHLLFFSSSSYTRGRAGYAIYSSLKSALVNFVQALADELYEDDIHVNIICPSRTDTPMRQKNFPNEDKKLLLDAETVAEQSLSVLFSQVTGQVIDIRKE